MTSSPVASKAAWARSAAAWKFVAAPMMTGLPGSAAVTAGVPFVVLMTSVFPWTASETISSGELPNAKPLMRSPLRSPTRSTSSRSRFWASRMASSGALTGTMSRAPCASAATIEVVARRMSTTSTGFCATSDGSTPSGVK